ncbi:MAG TPA: type II toxin-antitoxin system VapC family toxin [Allosphingosinicella sp.]|nr:type II toxin-antitoxin system VapC family toxin [Allosphingosinicella sp.]
MTSAVAYAELMRKVPDDDPEKEAAVEALFSLVSVLPFDAAAARSYRQVTFKRGTFDRLIVAHALQLGLTFVTNNVRDFADVPGLRIENWAQG